MQQYRPLPLILLLAVFSTSITYGAPTDRFQKKDERKIAYQVRRGASRHDTLNNPPEDIEDKNHDEQNIANYAGSFTKTLQHSSVSGEVTPFGAKQFEQLVKAMHSGNQDDFNAIVREGARKFVSPQGAFTWSLNCLDNALFKMASAPSITSAHGAAEMLEVYLKAICRDVKFFDYGTGAGTDTDPYNGGSKTANAAAVLQDLGGAFKGPRNAGVVDTSVLFRGPTTGDNVGPYISQFFWLPFHPVHINDPLHAREAQYRIAQKHEFGVGWNDFVAIQDGNVPVDYTAADFHPTDIRYIINGRDLGNFVHTDGPYEAYYNAVNILLTYGFPFAPNIPYQTGSMPNEDAFVNTGAPDVYAAVGAVAIEALKVAWAQKWRAHRRLRPEAMAGLIHRAKVDMNNPHNLHSSLFAAHAGIDTLEWVKLYNHEQFGVPGNTLTESETETYLLSQMFPEGSPTHPSYPAGHAVLAGACTTVIKAFFKDQELLTDQLDPVKPNANGSALVLLGAGTGEDKDLLTVGGELDKLASNVALGRNIAGVHYRTDGDLGAALGEQVAIRYLQSCARIYPEEFFEGFEFTKRDGTRIRVTQSKVTVL